MLFVWMIPWILLSSAKLIKCLNNTHTSLPFIIFTERQINIPSNQQRIHETQKFLLFKKRKLLNKEPIYTINNMVLSYDEITHEGMGGSPVKNFDNNFQRFAAEPTAQMAVVGSTAVLPCRVMGKVGHLQWTKDGFGLGTGRDLFGYSRYFMIGSDDEGDFSLHIHPVLLEDDAFYQCQVSASFDVPGIRSRPVRLTVYSPPDPPHIIPNIIKTTAGIATDIECVSRGGRPAPEIQWTDDSKRETIRNNIRETRRLMPDNKRFIVRSRLTFTPTRYLNNKTLTCSTSNQALTSALTRSAVLEIHFPPEVKLRSHPKEFIEGNDITFTCQAEGNPSDMTYRWFQNSIEINASTTKTLVLQAVSRNLHKGSISCEVSNTVGASKKTENIYIRYGPSFNTIPKDVMAEKGAEINLTCNVSSNPTSSIVWLRRNSNKIIGSGPSLRLRVTPLTAGMYRCIARVGGNGFEFPDLEGKMHVLIKGPPTILSDSEQQGRTGDNVELVCQTVSVPKPITVTWKYQGKTISHDDSRYEILQDEKKGTVRNILVIHDASSTDFGNYNCSVVNEYGTARKLIRLKEQQNVPVLVLICGVGGIVSIGVCAVSLIFCNKRKNNTKGESSNGSQYNGNRNGTMTVANMYSASSDAKINDNDFETYQPNSFRVPLPPRETGLCNGQNNKINSQYIYGYTHTNGRRSSLSDINAPEVHRPLNQGPPEFCTIRRQPRHLPKTPVLSTYQPNNNNHNYSTLSSNGSVQLDGYGQELSKGSIPLDGYRQEPSKGSIPLEGYRQEPSKGSIPLDGYRQEPSKGSVQLDGYRQEPSKGSVQLDGYRQEPSKGSILLDGYRQEHSKSSVQLDSYRQEPSRSLLSYTPSNTPPSYQCKYESLNSISRQYYSPERESPKTKSRYIYATNSRKSATLV